ncbi:DUF3846 domain-containing protein [Nitrospira sp. BLG_2]|uniref:DUF3846 domain-containing protein n=1 Tax=Nitrospira sp. BLG_2 TaxID=3397507 RepID=UPI003B9B4AA3
MMTKSIKWAVKEPNKPLEERKFEIQYENEDERSAKELKLAQTLVGGYVEMVWIGGKVQALVDEEGMYKPLEHNCGFVGTIVFVHDEEGEEGNFWGSLTEDELRKLDAWVAVHNGLQHPGNVGPKIFSGAAADEYRRLLAEDRKSQQRQWESF